MVKDSGTQAGRVAELDRVIAEAEELIDTTLKRLNITPQQFHLLVANKKDKRYIQ